MVASFGLLTEGNITKVSFARLQEVFSVSFDPDEGQRYLEGVDYPASKEAMLSAAEGNGAPSEMIEMIEGLPLGEFSDLEEFMNHLRAIPNRDN